MIKEGDTVVVGVSGGADSVCLLSLLSEYRKNLSFTLLAAHVHHGLRANADGDEEYVKELCEKLNVPLKYLHIDARKEAETLGVSVEEAGRIKRYEFFREVLGKEFGKIAVAHHRDDLCETMLFQLFRGSGISGLKGIAPVSGNVIRPLLSVSRAEIEAYLKKEGLSWRTDESNAELTYARNRIRHEIMPIAEEICSGAGEHMAQCAERIREIDDYIKKQAEEEKAQVYVCPEEDDTYRTAGIERSGIYNRYLKEGSRPVTILLRNEITAYPKALKGELILQALYTVAGRKRDIGLVQVNAVSDLFDSQVGKRREFIYGLMAEREYDGVRISIMKKNSEKTDSGKTDFEKTNSEKTDSEKINPEKMASWEMDVKKTDAENIREICLIPYAWTDGQEFSFKLGVDYEGIAKIIENPDFEKIPAGSYTKWLNCDTINNCLLFRHPKPGDYMIVTKDGGSKKLQDYFVNEKIPAADRNSLWVLSDGQRILWVVGYRIGEDAKITGETKTVLQIFLK